MIHLVTDSTADLTAERAAALGVEVVPLTVRFGDDELLDSVDIDADTFYARLQTDPEHPKTSQPSPERFAQVYERLLANSPDTVISLHLAAHLSGTTQSAQLASEQFDAARLRVIDSRTVSGGIQLLLQHARAAIDAGGTLNEVVSAIELAIPRVIVFVAVDTLTYLHRGGRIGRAGAFLGGVLRVKPVLAVADGEVLPRARARGRVQALTTMLELLEGEGPMAAIACMYTDSRAEGEALVARLREQYPGMEPLFGQLGPVVGTYGGPGALGIAGLRRG